MLVIKKRKYLQNLKIEEPIISGISGTHGKTTTCSINWKHPIQQKKRSYSRCWRNWQDFNTNAISGKGDIILVEADEYDKSFLSLSPTIAAINNIELEHLIVMMILMI